MKKIIYIVFILLLMGCNSNQPVDNEIVILDVSKSYPEKEILLSDIADITYVQLDDSNKDFIFSGNIGAVSANYIIGTDVRKGDVLVFSKEGKPITKFNHRGGGPEDYTKLMSIVYDEKANDLYTHDMAKIIVYDLEGDYKRTVSLPKGVSLANDYVLFDDKSIVMFDSNKKNVAGLLFQRVNNPPTKEEKEDAMNNYPNPSYLKISKIDGGIEDYINVPEDFFGVDLTVLADIGGKAVKAPALTFHIITHEDGLLLHNHATDTVFLYGYDDSLTPYMIQSPSVKDLNPGVYINTVVDRGGYQFIDLHILKAKLPGPVVTSQLIRDKATGNVFTSKITLTDYKEKYVTINRNTVKNFGNADEGMIIFTVEELYEALAAGHLSGELKAFVEQIPEDNDNNVLAFLKFKY